MQLRLDRRICRTSLCDGRVVLGRELAAVALNRSGRDSADARIVVMEVLLSMGIGIARRRHGSTRDTLDSRYLACREGSLQLRGCG